MEYKEFEKKMKSVRKSYIRAEAKRNELISAVESEFSKVKLSEIEAFFENSEKCVEEAICRYLYYGESSPSQIWDDILLGSFYQKTIPKHEEIITLMKLLNRYNMSERYGDVMKNEKDRLLKCLLQSYKESFLEDFLRTLALDTKNVSIEDPYVGDLKIALNHLRSRMIDVHMEKFRRKD